MGSEAVGIEWLQSGSEWHCPPKQQYENNKIYQLHETVGRTLRKTEML